MILAEESLLHVNDLPVELRTISYANQAGFSFDLATAEKIHIIQVLHYTKGNKSEAARLLNIGLTTLYRKIEEYGITQE